MARRDNASLRVPAEMGKGYLLPWAERDWLGREGSLGTAVGGQSRMMSAERGGGSKILTK